MKYPSKGKPYRAWANMKQRCNNPKAHNYHLYGAKGITVCEEWLKYQPFAEWWWQECERLNIDPMHNDYHLDKDLKDRTKQCYWPETCSLVPKDINNAEAVCKSYKFVNPEGHLVEVYNLRQFCLDNGLHYANMCALHKGKLQSANKGWAKYVEVPQKD